MDDKKAFVFDTNFIIQTKALDEVVSNLSDRYTVYVTQVSIDERIAQECRKIEEKFKEADSLSQKIADIAEVHLKTTIEKHTAYCKSGMQRKYEELFNEHIIPFSIDTPTFEAVLARSHKKEPPFIQGASDKGFMDALIWESLLAFFKGTGESEVLFLTDDNGFFKNADALQVEFKDVTGKKLEIRQNTFYKELLKPTHFEDRTSKTPKESEFDIERMREEIKTTITNLCYTTTYSEYGDEYQIETFSINQLVDIEYISSLFSLLEDVYNDHIFETELEASQVLDLDGRVTNGNERISMTAVKKAIDLYKEVKNNAPDYLNPFYSAVASIINLHYRKQIDLNELLSDDDQLPF